MKAPYKHFIAGCALVTTAGLAQADMGDLPGEVSGEISLGTDYRFRGISQLDRSPTVQGGVEYGHPNGFYAGVWASNVAFSDGAIELDPYIGFAGEFMDGAEFDVGVLYYGYPESSELDFWEFYSSVSYLGVSFGVDYSPDYFAGTGRYFYVHGAYDMDLPGDFGLGFHIGSNIFKNTANLSEFLEIDDVPGVSAGSTYLDWSITLSKSAFGIDWALAYVDTNLSESECFAGTKLCNATAVFSLTKSL